METLFYFFCLIICVNSDPYLWYDQCGISKYPDAAENFQPGRTPYIVDGMDAREYEFPWTVSVQEIEGNRHFCGGAIIHPEWILTAAHCVFARSPTTLQIVVGEHILSDPENGGTHFIEEIFVNKDYGPFIGDFDMAVMHLSSSIPFNENVTAICAPQADEDYNDVPAFVSGWGENDKDVIDPEATDHLQWAEVEVIGNTECQVVYALKPIVDPDYDQHIVSDDMICAATYPYTGSDACQGDSGGPMVVKSLLGVFSHVGVVSGGWGCGEGYPGVYVRTSFFIDWITDKLQA